jgi:hypothetical protein
MVRRIEPIHVHILAWGRPFISGMLRHQTGHSLFLTVDQNLCKYTRHKSGRAQAVIFKNGPK